MLRPFRTANYNTRPTPQTTNMEVGGPYPKTVICDRALNPQTSDYTQDQIPYIKKLFATYTLLPRCDVTNPFFCEIC